MLHLHHKREIIIKVFLKQSTGVLISSVNTTDNTTLTVTFNEAVYNTANGTGNLDVNDFSLTITGTAKFSDGSSESPTATPTSITRIDDRTLTLEIPSLSAAAIGDEIITVNAKSASSIYNANGHSAATSQTGTDNTVSLSDKGPLFSSVAPSSDNTTLTVTLMRRHIIPPRNW